MPAQGVYASCRDWLMHAEFVELDGDRYTHYIATDSCVIDLDTEGPVDRCGERTRTGRYLIRSDTLVMMEEGDSLSERQRMVAGTARGQKVLWRTPHWKALYERQGSLRGYDPLFYVGGRFEGKYPDCRVLGWYPEGDFAADRAMDNRLDVLFGAHVPYKLFLIGLQIAVVTGDRSRVARIVDYPLEVRIGDEQATLRKADELVGRYEDLFTPEVVEAIERQTYGTLFANDQGVMIGDGQVWFGAVCDEASCAEPRIRIIALNP